MAAAAVLLTVESGKSEGSYSFVCPVCEDTIEKYADRKVVMLLLSAGVEVQEVGQLALPVDAPAGRHGRASGHPAGAGEAQDEDEQPPLTIDHLIDLHFLLERDDWLDQLIAAHE